MDRRSFVVSAATGIALPLAVRGLAFGQKDGSLAKLPAAVASLKSRLSEAKPITLAEREHRVQRAQALMRQNRLDAIMLAGGTSLDYFTGVSSGNSERMLAFVLPRTGNSFFVCPAFEEGRIRERLSAVPGGGQARLYVWQEDENPYVLTGKGLREAGISAGSVGMDETMPFTYAYGVAKACPALEVKLATPVTAGCRMVKSTAELALMQLANNITLAVYEAAWKSCEPGMTTHQFSQLIARAYEQTGFPGNASCQTGKYSALPHGSMHPEVIRENAIVWIDDGCKVEGYQSDVTRTFVLGSATDKMKRVFDIVHKAQSAALAAARPGAECQAVDAAARKVVTDAGYGPVYKYFTHRLGHGIGMDIHEWPYLVKGNTTLLQPNITTSDEPGIYIVGEFGVRLEDDMHVTESGAILFTPQSPSLEHPFAEA